MNNFVRKKPIVIILVALIGTIAIANLSAASPKAAFEAESAVLSGNATKVSYSDASGGSAIRFDPMQSTGTGGASCSSSVGAGSGAQVKGTTTYSSTTTTTVRNVIFDGSHSDDLVRVNKGKVIFENVTFRGTGTGATGHSLEIKDGGSAEVRNSLFEGKPSEDTLQTQFNGTVLIECNIIKSSPGEDHVDTKDGGAVTLKNNDFQSNPTAQTIQNHNDQSPVHLIGNKGLRKVFYEDGQTNGTIVNNQIAERLWMYDVTNILVEGNTIALVKHGESGTRDPVNSYFLNNMITTFQFNGGSCYKTGGSGASLTQCSSGEPSWY